MTLSSCQGKPAGRAIRARRVKILPASAPTRVRDSSAPSVEDATAEEIAAASADGVDARMGAPTGHIAEEETGTVEETGEQIAGRTGDPTGARIAAEIVDRIAAGDALSGGVAVDIATGRIAGITADTLRNGVRN